MRKLRGIGADLGREGAVKELLAALQDQGPNSISTFEFLSSGAVRQLRSYLQGGALVPAVSKRLLLGPGRFSCICLECRLTLLGAHKCMVLLLTCFDPIFTCL